MELEAAEKVAGYGGIRKAFLHFYFFSLRSIFTFLLFFFRRSLTLSPFPPSNKFLSRPRYLRLVADGCIRDPELVNFYYSLGTHLTRLD